MKRSEFLKLLALAPVAGSAMSLQEFGSMSQNFGNSPKMPVLFIGHGHPMNALFDNDFTRRLGEIGRSMPRPKAIMVVSAHWETKGTYVSLNPRPKAIYDFGRFDDALFREKYEPGGHPELAREVMKQVPSIMADAQMGLDHGAWTVLKFLFPAADVPVFQLSIDHSQSPQQHFEMAQALKKMREKGVLIIGSGNVVHNLGRLNWQNINAATEDWALEFDGIVKDRILKGNYQSLVNYNQLGHSAKISVPTEDHYLPMIYSLGLADKNESVDFIYEGFQFANISMRCFKIG